MNISGWRKERYKKNIEQSKSILEYNRKRIYKLSDQKYSYLSKALKNVQKDLLRIIAYWLKHDCIAYGSHDMVYFLGTQNGTYNVRKKTTTGVTNRHINYLCAIGLLKKLEQYTGLDKEDRLRKRWMRKQNVTIVNRNLLRYDKNYDKHPINTFEVVKYTSDYLKACDERAKRLLDAKITEGNISYNQLAVNGLEDIAKEIYFDDRTLAVDKKWREYNDLAVIIDSLVDYKGYTTKKEIYELSSTWFDSKELDKLFKIFKTHLWRIWNYKRPTKEEKEIYALKSDEWIITRRKEETNMKEQMRERLETALKQEEPIMVCAGIKDMETRNTVEEWEYMLADDGLEIVAGDYELILDFSEVEYNEEEDCVKLTTKNGAMVEVSFLNSGRSLINWVENDLFTSWEVLMDSITRLEDAERAVANISDTTAEDTKRSYMEDLEEAQATVNGYKEEFDQWMDGIRYNWEHEVVRFKRWCRIHK